MLLTGTNICFFLLDKGYLPASSVIDGDFSVFMTPSRNSNFIINKNKDHSFFVKQASTQEREKQETLRHEATCYWLANNEEEYQNLNAFLPEFHEYDYINHILILEYMKGSVPLNRYYNQVENFPLALAEKKAELLASFHLDIYDKIQKGKSLSLFKQSVPAVFVLVGNRQKFWSNSNNPSERQMLELINEAPDFSDLVENVRNSWKASSLIHGDIKSANFLINDEEEADITLRLIDWEMADVGDPCWDVAAIFQIYFLLYINADVMREFHGKDDKRSSLSLEKMQPSLAHFWQKYSELMNFSEEEAQEKLTKTINFCALKLIHTCFESTNASENLPPGSAKMLQLSLNILQTPEEAISTLLGINQSIT